MTTVEFIEQFTPQLERVVYLRAGTSDHQVWSDTFGGAGGYHVPPLDMPTPKTVLDLGANIGLTAAHYAEMWPDALVWMVEPNPENIEFARKHAPRCVSLPVAVAKDAGYRWLEEDGLRAEAYRLAGESEGARRVYAFGMRQLIEVTRHSAGIDFCKMDIEGTEWEIFDDPTWAPGVRHLLVELHGESGEPSEDTRARGVLALQTIGFSARHHPPHPQALWAVRR